MSLPDAAPFLFPREQSPMDRGLAAGFAAYQNSGAPSGGRIGDINLSDLKDAITKSISQAATQRSPQYNIAQPTGTSAAAYNYLKGVPGAAYPVNPVLAGQPGSAIASPTVSMPYEQATKVGTPTETQTSLAAKNAPSLMPSVNYGPQGVRQANTLDKLSSMALPAYLGYKAYSSLFPNGISSFFGSPATNPLTTSSGMMAGAGEGAFPGVASGTVASDVGAGAATDAAAGAATDAAAAVDTGGILESLGLGDVGAEILSFALKKGGQVKSISDAAERFDSGGYTGYTGSIESSLVPGGANQGDVTGPSATVGSFGEFMSNVGLIGMLASLLGLNATPTTTTATPSESETSSDAATGGEGTSAPGVTSVASDAATGGEGVGSGAVGSDGGAGAGGGGGDGGAGTGGGGGDGGGEAHGGLMHAYKRMAMGGLGDYSDGGRLLRGPGDGVSDSIPATIGGKRPARLADGEFVVPARIVSELGNGSTEAGARKLYAMMNRIQSARGKTVGKGKVAKNTRADKYLPG